MIIKRKLKNIIEEVFISKSRKRKLQIIVNNNLFNVLKFGIVIFATFCILGYNLFQWLMEKDEEVSLSYERTKLKRLEVN